MRFPIPRDLKEPLGWRFSSLRSIRLACLSVMRLKLEAAKGERYHPAAFDSAEDSFNGVAIQGLGISGEPRLPMLKENVRC